MLSMLYIIFWTIFLIAGSEVDSLIHSFSNYLKIMSYRPGIATGTIEHHSFNNYFKIMSYRSGIAGTKDKDWSLFYLQGLRMRKVEKRVMLTILIRCIGGIWQTRIAQKLGIVPCWIWKEDWEMRRVFWWFWFLSWISLVRCFLQSTNEEVQGLGAESGL